MATREANGVKSVYLLSSSTSARLSISDVLFWRRSSFCLGWHFCIWATQSTCTFSLQMRQRNPWRVCPAVGGCGATTTAVKHRNVSECVEIVASRAKCAHGCRRHLCESAMCNLWHKNAHNFVVVCHRLRWILQKDDLATRE